MTADCRLMTDDWRLAVERLRDGARREPLADAGRAGEHEARRQRIRGNGTRQQLDQTRVADDVTEGHDSGMLSRGRRRLAEAPATVDRVDRAPRHPYRDRRVVPRSLASCPVPAPESAPARG